MPGKLSYQKGRQGEAYAASYLQGQGYQILDRNVRCGGGELDLVASKNGVIYFVEVKARKEGTATAAESIAPYKRRRLQCAALAWLARHYQTETMEAVFLAVLLALNDCGEVSTCQLIETGL